MVLPDSIDRTPARNPLWKPASTINCKGTLLLLEPPVIMGILNVTPDSFFAGSRVAHTDKVLAYVGEMREAGAGMIDVGGYSSRPGAPDISEQEELDRVIPVIELLNREWPDLPLSVDTWRARIADEALKAGASIVNDISAGRFDSELWSTVARHKAPYILMHMQGTPATMQHKPAYEDVTREILDFFIERVTTLRASGVNDIILDPGFGFGKTAEHNFTLLRNLHTFRLTGLPVLAGISRKSMITRTLGVDAEDALTGTIALHMIALQQGASILRVHDVKEAVQVRTLFQHLYSENIPN